MSSTFSGGDEKVGAGYLMGTAKINDWTLISGVRVEHTKWSGGPLNAQQEGGSYTNVLLDFLVRYDFGPNWTLRAAYTGTVGRPNLSDLTAGETEDFCSNGELVVNRSNPDLKPRKSRNIDLSLDWYLAAAELFYKNIDDEVFTITQNDVLFDRNNRQVSVTIIQPTNVEGAHLIGTSLQYQQDFYFLPAPWNNLGANLNSTYIVGDYTIPTSFGSRNIGYPQQPRLTSNATLYYSSKPFEFKVSYNFTGKFIDTIAPDNPARDQYWSKREQVDAQARFQLIDGLSLIGEVQNITDAGRTELTGPHARYLQEDARFGRTYWIGIDASL